MGFIFPSLRLTFAIKINTKDLDRKIRVGAVSYLNTKPLLFGIRHSSIIEEIELKIDYPSRIATMLLQDEIDIGLVPVAIIPRMREHYLYTDFCIGSDGPVASVGLFSDLPLEEIRRVLLDYQSRTSVALAKILLKDFWKISPQLVDAEEDFTVAIGGSTAGVVIGDRALTQRKISPFTYDLGQAWKDLTGLPFVYAAWISNKPLDPSFVDAFNEANLNGLTQIHEVVKETPFPAYDLDQYYRENVSYHLDNRKMLGLKAFLSYLQVGALLGV